MSPTTPEQAVNEQAYVLFYRRRLTGVTGHPTTTPLPAVTGHGLGLGLGGPSTSAFRWGGIVPLEGNGLPDEPDN